MDALTALVTSEARARMLDALFARPERALYQQELVRATGLPLRAVQRELARLTRFGHVRSSIVGGRRVYGADPSSAVFSELRSLVLKLRGAAAQLAQAIADENGVELAWVFGSMASGEATASSDVDLMILGRADARRLRSSLGAVERALGRTVNEHIVSTHEWTERLRRREGFMREVRRGPKLWVRGGDQDLRALDPKTRP